MKNPFKKCKVCKKDMPKGLNNVCSKKCDEAKKKLKRAKIREKKKISVSSLTLKADLIFGQYIRIRDSIKTTGGRDKCVCITCKDVVDNIQCGHFITRASRSTRWQEQNANGQCPKCNCWGGGRQYEHGLAIDGIYGDGTADRLVRLGNEPVKVTREFLEEIIMEFKLKLENIV